MPEHASLRINMRCYDLVAKTCSQKTLQGVSLVVEYNFPTFYVVLINRSFLEEK